MIRKRVVGGVAVAALALGVAGCTADGGGSGDNVVTIYGPISGDALTWLQADLDAWAEAEGSGIEVQYDGSPDFLTIIVSQVDAGNPPDIVINPVPGLVRDQSRDMIPLEDLGLDVAGIQAGVAEGLGELGAADGVIYALPMAANVKSVVFYNPAAFERAGLTVPTTDDELTALQRKIVDEELGYPWCVGLEDGTSTGWPVTDWLEEYVLRYGGIDDYNKWVAGEIKFSDPLVKQAGERVAEMLLAPGQVNGGGVAAATTNFGNSNQLWAEGKENGQCFMMRQGSFIVDYFPDEIKAQMEAGDFSNANLFQLPSLGDDEPVMLGGGDLVGAFSDDENTIKVLEYLTSSEFGTHGYAGQARGWLSPHKDFDTSHYGTELQIKAQELIRNSAVFAFDGSDQMPAAIGAGAGLGILTQWFTGSLTMEEAFAELDKLW